MQCNNCRLETFYGLRLEALADNRNNVMVKALHNGQSHCSEQKAVGIVVPVDSNYIIHGIYVYS
jgi:hypothetical protein